MKRNIDPTSTPDIYRLTDLAPWLELYANESFDTPNGQTVLAGNVDRGDFFRRLQLSVASGVITFPTFENVDTTEDSPTNQQATYSAYIRASGQEPIPWVDRFGIAPTVQDQTSISWTTLRIHKAGIIARERFTLSRDDIYAYVDMRIALALGVAGILDKGITEMVAGAAAVSSVHTTPTANIQLTGLPGVFGALSVREIVPGSGFTIGSSEGADGGNVGWAILAT